MASFIDRIKEVLKGIFDAKILESLEKVELNISILSNNNFSKEKNTSNVRRENEKCVIKKDGSIAFNREKLSEEQMNSLKDSLRRIRSNEENEYLILDKNSYNTVEGIRRLESFEKIKILKEVLNDADYSALQTGVYIKSLEGKGRRGEIGERKRELINKFGERGKNISNLYNTGYFDSLIIPMYKKMSRAPDFEQRAFLDVFDKLVNDFPLAIFIDSGMTVEQIKTEILENVERNRKFNIGKLHIHGIGDPVCNNIQEAVKQVRKEKDSLEFSIRQTGDIMFASVTWDVEE